MKKWRVYILLPALTLFLSGCLGAVQIEEYGYVQSFGIDKGENKKYAYSFLLQNYQGSGQDGTSQAGKQGVVIGGEGDTIFEALALVTAGLPYELSFSRTATVILSEELAREGEFEQLFTIAQAKMKLRSSVKLMITHGNTREFKEVLQVENSTDIMQMQKSILYSFSREGTVPMTNFAIFYEGIKTGRYDPIIVYGGIAEEKEEKNAKDAQSGKGNGNSGQEKGKEEEKPKESSIHGNTRFGGMTAYADGTALFNGMRMVGVLNGEETKYLLTARGELGTTYASYSYGEDGLVVLVLSQQMKPKVELELGSAPRANIKIPLICEIYSDNKNMAAQIWEESLQTEIEEQVENAIEGIYKICRDLDCDALSLGKEASKKFSDMKEWKEFDWKKKYGRTEVEFEVSIELRNTYTQSDVE